MGGVDATFEQTAILERTKTYLVGGRAYDSIPDEAVLARLPSGLIQPYIVVHYGVLYATQNDRSLTGEEGQPLVMPVTFECWGPTEEAARAVAAAVRDTFVGWRPSPAASALRALGGTTFTDRDAAGVPTRYMQAVSVETVINLGEIGDTLIDPTAPDGAATRETVVELVDAKLQAHVLSPTPHPVYDDGPSLVLLFENRIT